MMRVSPSPMRRSRRSPRRIGAGLFEPIELQRGDGDLAYEEHLPGLRVHARVVVRFGDADSNLRLGIGTIVENDGQLAAHARRVPPEKSAM